MNKRLYKDARISIKGLTPIRTMGFLKANTFFHSKRKNYYWKKKSLWNHFYDSIKVSQGSFALQYRVEVFRQSTFTVHDCAEEVCPASPPALQCLATLVAIDIAVEFVGTVTMCVFGGSRLFSAGSDTSHRAPIEEILPREKACR